MSAEINFEVDGGWGTITLNAPKRMNALSEDMCAAIGSTLAEWRDDNNVRAVMIKAAEGSRAFCTGGDIRSLYQLRTSGDIDRAARFFQTEYLTNWRIANFPKPYVALIDGAVMGGGVGVSVHGGYRVATDKALFAMPECGIGLYPDVGATHVLPRLPGASGMWLGLTGARIGHVDMLGLGLATHTVPSDALGDAEAALRDVDWIDGPREAVEAALDDIHTVIDGPSPAITARHEIDDAFSRSSVEAILAQLEQMKTSWADEQIEAIGRGSPLSLKVTHRAITAGATSDITEALTREYFLTQRFVETGAYVEGVRAAIIDKDRTPNWPHPTLASATETEVDGMFVSANDVPDFGW